MVVFFPNFIPFPARVVVWIDGPWEGCCGANGGLLKLIVSFRGETGEYAPG
jgi:hypothetical protein